MPTLFSRAGARLLILPLVLALFTLAPAPQAAHAEQSPQTVSRVSTGQASLLSLEDQILTLTNLQRRTHGCKDLRKSVLLRTSARGHSVKMGRANKMSHRLPGEPYFSTRITRAGYKNWKYVAENIARGFDTPREVVRAWMNSPSHRRNLLNCKLRELGVGVVRQHNQLWWTQNFGWR